MLPRTRFRLRILAALLAWTGMLALPLRTLAACPMLEPSQAAGLHHAAPMAGMDEHAGHDMSERDGAVPAAPGSSNLPAHDICPDLAHCAVAAIPAALDLPAAPTTPAVALRVSAQTAPLSAARALEPPPPKA